MALPDSQQMYVFGIDLVHTSQQGPHTHIHMRPHATVCGARLGSVLNKEAEQVSDMPAL